MTDDDRLRSGALTDAQVERFIRLGFIRIDRAFPRELADEAASSYSTTRRFSIVATLAHNINRFQHKHYNRPSAVTRRRMWDKLKGLVIVEDRRRQL